MTEANSPSGSEAEAKPRVKGGSQWRPDPEAWIATARIREHLAELVELGMTRKEIARKAGVSPDRVSIVLDNKHHRVQRKTGEALLAVKWNPTYDDRERHVPWPTKRRVGALNRLGHTLASVAREAGVTESALAQIMRERNRQFVNAAQALGVEVAYERLSKIPGDRPQARLIARRDGWPPPEAYLDGEIEELEENTTDRVRKRWEKQSIDTPGELLYDLIESNNYTWPEVAKHIGTTPTAIRKWCSDISLPRSGYVKKMCALFKVDELPVKTASTGPRPKNRQPSPEDD